ncbi:hypothetical protein BCR35DRAFT_353786 [Leucosporidium creatinivorum]|uniref:Uncharacterized protein n=1 Tax=Leucosporidium creatinivorum TaxID=106004 RepID=A0A1Y2EVA0_9BASI|nr:hypothetical protein BCR35DRAFT_353786 [Leucosporidium creatinivorum]
MALPASDELLKESVDFSAAPNTVQHLSTARLALCALREDLDLLTRQRAYGLYLMRQLTYNFKEGDKRGKEELFELDHSVALSLADLPRLSPAQLLIAQFTPDATQELCTAAGRLFLTQAASYQRGQLTQLKCQVFKLERHGGDASMETEKMVLVVEKERLVLQQGSDELFSCAGDEIGGLKYLGGRHVEESGQNKQECSLRINCRRYRSKSRAVDDPAVATIYLGALATEDPAFATLRMAIKGWSRAHGFKMAAEDVDSAIPEPPKRSRPRSRERYPIDSSRPREDRVRERSLSPIRPALSSRRRSRSPEPARMEHVDRPLRLASSEGPAWRRFVSDRLTTVDWTPGFWTRLSAFLTSIDPQAKLALPTFTPEEVVFLSFRPDPNTLPALPHAVDSSARFIPRTRIAVERLYRDHPHRLDIAQTRYLLTAPHDYPELRDYALAIEKIVACRDLFRDAFQQLYDHVARRRSDNTTRDPVEKILALDLHRFCGGRPCLKPHESLSIEGIGAGPSRRFADQLSGIVDFEREAIQAFMPLGRPKVL